MDVRLNSSFSKGVFDNLAILQQYLPGYAPNPHRKKHGQRAPERNSADSSDRRCVTHHGREIAKSSQRTESG